MSGSQCIFPDNCNRVIDCDDGRDEEARVVATAVLVMMLFLVVMVGSVPGHAMVSLSVMMDLMNGIALP